jgi:hypothetical protein
MQVTYIVVLLCSFIWLIQKKLRLLQKFWGQSTSDRLELIYLRNSVNVLSMCHQAWRIKLPSYRCSIWSFEGSENVDCSLIDKCNTYHRCCERYSNLGTVGTVERHIIPVVFILIQYWPCHIMNDLVALFGNASFVGSCFVVAIWVIKPRCFLWQIHEFAVFSDVTIVTNGELRKL